VLAIAHRTPRTAAACQRLADLGVAVFEIDLQFLAGVPVVSHFLPPARALPFLRQDRWRFTVRARSKAEEDMAAVVERVPAGCAVLVDLKTDDVRQATTLVELLRASGRPPEGWYVSGKDAGALAVVAAAGYRTWLSVATRPEFVGALNGQLPTGLDAVTVRHTYLDRATVGRLRQHQPRVMAWTVAKVYRAEELADLGVAGITSDSEAVHRFVASR
jgi:glycerophosphoryl diester phosphodiesterase